MHAHLFRHSRSMHLYQAGIPLSYIKDFLGHVSINTTSIYASADISMLKAAMEKAVPNEKDVKGEPPIWKGNEDMILKLCGLKYYPEDLSNKWLITARFSKTSG